MVSEVTKKFHINIGELIKVYRKELGLRQIAYAFLTGTTQGNISKIEKGILEPSTEFLEFLYLMGFSIDELFKEMYNGRRQPDKGGVQASNG